MLLLSGLPYLKLLFYIDFTIIKAFITTGHQFLYPLLVEMTACYHSRPATPRLVMHVITKFLELSNPFPIPSVIEFVSCISHI